MNSTTKKLLPLTLFAALGLAAVPMLRNSAENVAPAPEHLSADVDPLPEGVIRIGSIADDVVEEIATFQPFVDYLAAQLHEQGIGHGEVVIAQSMQQMTELLKSGAVDIYIDSPFPSLRVSSLAGAQPILRRWKKGVSEYNSVIFARKGRFEGVEDLAGHTITFEDEFSTSGYLLPKATLLNKGLSLVQSDGGSVAGALAYKFSHDEESSVMWVLAGQVDAAALGQADFEELAGQRRNELVILSKTINVPRHVLAVRGDLPESLVAEIQNTLIAMSSNEAGRSALQAFERTTKFDQFPGGATYLEPIADLMRRVEDEMAH